MRSPELVLIPASPRAAAVPVARHASDQALAELRNLVRGIYPRCWPSRTPGCCSNEAGNIHPGDNREPASP